MARAAATAVVHIDDERFKVTEWRFAPDAETGWHVHGHDYVIVPLTDGVLRLEEPGGASRAVPLSRHLPYSRRTGVEHNVINGGDAPLAFVEVEVVDDHLQKRREAVLERFMAAWNTRDVDALMACMAESCAFHASSGSEAEGQRHQGRPAVRAAYEAIFRAYSEAAWQDAEHRVMGDRGVSSWRFVGTTTNGASADVDGCDLFTFDGELISLKDSFRKARTS
jgi:beta-alanine degradation protein BauB